YTIAATATGLTGATSTSFTVTAAAAADHLVFGQQPTNTTATAAISPAVTVQIVDAFGNQTTSTATVTLSATGPDTFTAGSTTTVSAVGGLATFSNPHLNTDGSYTIDAAATGLTGATSTSFAVTGLVVAALTPTPTGFVATFSKAFDPTQLNLYDASSTF